MRAFTSKTFRAVAVGVTAMVVPVALMSPAVADEAQAGDPSGDVVVDGGEMTYGGDRSADLVGGVVITDGSTVEYRLEPIEAGADFAAQTFKITARVALEKPKGAEKAPRPYKVQIVVNNDPFNPIRITSTQSGSKKKVPCGDATSSVLDISNRIDIFIPKKCVGGKKVKSLKSIQSKVLLTAIDNETGARGRDGMSLPRVSL